MEPLLDGDSVDPSFGLGRLQRLGSFFLKVFLFFLVVFKGGSRFLKVFLCFLVVFKGFSRFLEVFFVFFGGF